MDSEDKNHLQNRLDKLKAVSDEIDGYFDKMNLGEFLEITKKLEAIRKESLIYSEINKMYDVVKLFFPEKS